MNIHEHQAKKLLKEYGVPVPVGVFGFSVDEILQKSKLRTAYRLFAGYWSSLLVIG